MKPPIAEAKFPGFKGPDDPMKDFFREPADADPRDLPGEPDSSITPSRIQFSIRLRFNPIRNLTPHLLSGYLDSFRLGFFRNAALTWDAMERRDSRLQTVAPKRKKSVSRHGWEVLTVDDSPAAQAQKNFLEAFYNNVSATTAMDPDESGGFSLLVRQMMDAVGKRYAVHEIVWQPQPDGSLKAKFIFCPLWWFEGTCGKLRFLQSEFDIYGLDMEAGGWMVTVGDGIMEACSVAYMFKHLPLRDWLNYSERFGTPGILGETDAAQDTNEWRAMEEAVKAFASDWAAVVNSGSKITLVETKGGGNETPFAPLVALMDEEMTRLWRGSDLGTSSKANGTGASLQAGEGEILEADDAQMIGETLNNHVTRFALEWKFGTAPKLAYLKIRASETEATDLDLQVDEFLLGAGAPLGVSGTLERYGRSQPKPGEELLKQAQPPANLRPVGDGTLATLANSGEPAAPGQAVLGSINRGLRAKVAAAISPDLNLINRKMVALTQITDPELARSRATEILHWIADNEAHLTNNPELADALHKSVATAFLNGAASKT